MAKAPPKIVFIDTEQFDAKALSFSNTVFARLAELVEAGQVKVLLTDVVVGEVRRHILRGFKEARKKLGQQFGGLFANLKITPKPPVVTEEYWVNAETEVVAEFEALLTSLKAEVVKVSPELVKVVFDWYFDYSAPFDTEKRKSEFPDAFSIASLNKWAKEKSQQVHVVSNDAAFSVVAQQEAAPDLIRHESLAAFFELFPDAELAATLKAALADFLDDEDNWQFGEEEFKSLDFYVEDAAHVEVENVTVSWTEPHRLYVVAAKDGTAVVSGKVFVSFFADIQGINEPVEETALVSAEYVIKYDKANPAQIEVVSVNYESQWAIDVTLPSEYFHEG